MIAALLDWRLPSGHPVIARASRREEVHRGAYADRAPDIVVELALDSGYGLSLVPTPWSEGGDQGAGIPSVRILGVDEMAGGRGRGMNGTHRNEGIWIAVGPGALRHGAPDRLTQVAPWIARAMGLVWTSPKGTGQESVAYDDDEEAMVAERLRALGYLD